MLWDGGTAVIAGGGGGGKINVIPACLYVIPATPPSFPRVNTSFPRLLRHSRGRGNPEKNKARRFPPLRVLCTTPAGTLWSANLWCFLVALPLWIPAFAGMTDVVHTSPSRSEGDACEARRGCPKITTILTSFPRLTVIPATPPSFPRVYTSFPRLPRHSRGGGNLGKNKARRFPPLRGAKGDACEARRGCPKITTILTSFPRLTVIPATPPSFPRVYT